MPPALTTMLIGFNFSAKGIKSATQSDQCVQFILPSTFVREGSNNYVQWDSTFMQSIQAFSFRLQVGLRSRLLVSEARVLVSDATFLVSNSPSFRFRFTGFRWFQLEFLGMVSDSSLVSNSRVLVSDSRV